MNRYVLDASVIVKWLIPESPTEHHVEQALALLTGLRLIPDTITDDIADLQELGIITTAQHDRHIFQLKAVPCILKKCVGSLQ
jgi:predicted nucleic acid-binding protein